MFVSEDKKLVSEWNFELNKDIDPTQCTTGMHKKVWWNCPAGHPYLAAINKRSQGSSCPYCSGHKVLSGFNDLKTTNPKLCEEWDYEKNFPLTPEQVSAGSNKIVFWKCEKGHVWDESINGRSKSEKGCPICSNRRLLVGYNDLQSKYPEIAKEWDYEKNKDLTPDQVLYGSGKKVYWKCSVCGHKWKTNIYARTQNGTGCVKCSKDKALQTRRENLVKEVGSIKELPCMEEWDYDKNINLDPAMLTPGSNIMAYWKCSKCGNSWEAPIVDKTHGEQCPYCLNRKVKSGFNDLYSKYPELIEEWNYDKNIGEDPKELVYSSSKKVWWKCK